jgi:hypothetical protein
LESDSFVQQIEPAKDAVRVEEAVELFSTVDKLVLSSLTHELVITANAGSIDARAKYSSNY